MKEALQKLLLSLSNTFDVFASKEFMRDYIMYRHTEFLNFDSKENLQQDVERHLDKVGASVNALDAWLFVAFTESTEEVQKAEFIKACREHIEKLRIKFSEESLSKMLTESPLKDLSNTFYKRESKLFREVVGGFLDTLDAINLKYEARILKKDPDLYYWENLPFQNWFRDEVIYDKLINKLVDDGWCVLTEGKVGWIKNPSIKTRSMTMRQALALKTPLAAFAFTICSAPMWKKFFKFNPLVLSAELRGKVFMRHFLSGEKMSVEIFHENREEALTPYLSKFDFLKDF